MFFEWKQPQAMAYIAWDEKRLALACFRELKASLSYMNSSDEMPSNRRDECAISTRLRIASVLSPKAKLSMKLLRVAAPVVVRFFIAVSIFVYKKIETQLLALFLMQRYGYFRECKIIWNKKSAEMANIADLYYNICTISASIIYIDRGLYLSLRCMPPWQ